MKIGITCYPTFGGSGVLASELGRFLAARNHEVHFITSKIPYRFNRGFQERMFFHTVDQVHYPLFEHEPYSLTLASKMKEVFITEGLDLLHVHYAIPHAVSAFLAAAMCDRPMPIVTTLHGTDITLVGQEKSLYDITRLGINRSTIATTVSDYLKLETERVFRPDVPIQRIYNFVDMNLFRKGKTDCRREHFAQPDQILFLHISNFRKVKRILDVVRIFAHAAEDVDGVLLMVGEGPQTREARSLAAELGIQDRVRFLGNQEDVSDILACSDVLLFPSEVESFGLAALEAMASEMPVLAYRSGGIPEVVEDSVTGYLADLGDSAALGRRALELGRDPGLRKRMGTAGRKRALSLFGPEQIVPQYEACYRKAIELAGGELPED